LLIVAILGLERIRRNLFHCAQSKIGNRIGCMPGLRNPMVLAGLAFLLSLGIWFQSALFVLWVLISVLHRIAVLRKVFEERELEFRFGASYLETKRRRQCLFPENQGLNDTSLCGQPIYRPNFESCMRQFPKVAKARQFKQNRILALE